MSLPRFLSSFLAAGIPFLATASLADQHEDAPKPNVIFILADDLGYGDLGIFGSKQIKTPNLDRLAKQGLILTDFYAGATVCAPSRCVLMTGQHTGRAWVRGNANNQPKQTLQPGTTTVAGIFKDAGYATALTGKWGLGEEKSTGHPLRQGFDFFYGYLNQRHAHNYYPEFLYLGEERVPLKNKDHPDWIAKRKADNAEDDGAGWAIEKVDYAPDLIHEQAMNWLEDVVADDTPFFLYYPTTIPHANNEAGRGIGDGQEIPDHGIYADEDWPDPDKGQAAMVTYLDERVGDIVAFLEEKGIAENTLIIFSSDNGHHKEGGNDPEFFDANGPLRGMKRDLYDGGIRVPTIAYWPGTIAPGSQSDHIAYFGDLLATAADITGAPVPEETQSISFLPTLKGDADAQENHDYLYWESYERGGKQAVRFGKWKAVRQPMMTGEVELYDLAADLGEGTNLADQYPEVVAKAEGFMKEAHVTSPDWTVPQGNKKPQAQPEPGDGVSRF
ncbi:MAG: arylsulfatase [Verrucomicrobiota bacterium]